MFNIVRAASFAQVDAISDELGVVPAELSVLSLAACRFERWAKQDTVKHLPRSHSSIYKVSPSNI